MKNMKKLLYVVLAVFIANTAFAQSNKAKSILDKVSAKYDSYNTLQSNFLLKVTPRTGEASTVNGKILVNKPEDKFKIELADQDIYGDANTTWTVSKEVKEVQVNSADEGNQKIGPSNIFTFYKKGFNYKYVGTNNVAKEGKVDVIDLVPTDKTTNYQKITLRVNSKSHIHDVSILDKSGAKYTYAFNALYVNHAINNASLQFNKQNYPGYEVVDLR